MIGEPDKEPLRCGADVGQYLAGVNAALHTLAALLYQQATGLGQHVDVSVLETLSVMLGITGFFSNWTHDSQIRVRNGQRSPALPVGAASPFGRSAWAGATTMLPCKDGWLAVAAQSAAQWEGLCTMIGRQDLIELPVNEAGEPIPRTREETEAALIEGFKDKTRAELFELGGIFRCPTGISYDTLEIVDDPHLQERGFFREVAHPLAGALPLAGSPWEFGSAAWVQGRAPLLGEHNKLIYGELLGLSDDEQDRLRRDGIT
jgi:crotonobetainyl-CoA:carnitine CoA-transferase CaiB-like acyl-CoA transferase